MKLKPVASGVDDAAPCAPTGGFPSPPRRSVERGERCAGREGM
jgi:hypothetical protein